MMLNYNARVIHVVRCEHCRLFDRYLSQNRLTAVDVGLFDKNTALTRLYVIKRRRVCEAEC